MKSIKKSWMVLLTAMMPGLVTGMVLFLLLPVWNTTKMLKKEIAPLFS